MAFSVPLGITFFRGIITNKVCSVSFFTKAIWLPFPLLGAYSNPADLSALITSFDEIDGSLVMILLQNAREFLFCLQTFINLFNYSELPSIFQIQLNSLT